jgi:hypothetical protein
VRVQARRLALGCCLHGRLVTDALAVVEMDVIRKIGQCVAPQSLTSSVDAAQQLAATQHARMLRGEAILPGTLVHFEAYGDGVYVGDSDAGGHRRQAQEGYAFRFGADATMKQIHVALMESSVWSVLPGSELAPRGEIAVIGQGQGTTGEPEAEPAQTEIPASGDVNPRQQRRLHCCCCCNFQM